MSLLLLVLLPFPPINIAYTAKFDSPVSDGTKVSFAFDNNPNNPKGTVQHTTVKNGIARISLDPMNGSSKTMTITIPQKDISIQKLASSIFIPKDNINIVLTRISGNAFHSKPSNDVTVFSIQPQQLQNLRTTARYKSEIKGFVLLLLFIIYLFYILRITILRRISKPYFGSLIIGFIIESWLLLHITGIHTSRSSYRILAIILLLTLSIMLIVNTVIGKRFSTSARKKLIIIDDVGIIAFMVIQFRLFTTRLGGFPDEMAHLSYIAYMKLHGGWLPNFREMRIYQVKNGNSLILNNSQPNSFNYLGHPPLYYKVMAQLSNIIPKGNMIVFDMNHLRMISFGIGITGVILLFYIAFTRIPTIPLLHVLFGLILISPANMVYNMSGLNNDTLLLVTVTVFTLGAIRFMEERYNFLTYLLITVGICSTLLTKLTGGVMVIAMTIFIIAQTLWTRKWPNLRPHREIYFALSVLILPLGYYLKLLSRFHTIQPSYQKLAPTEFITSGWYTPSTDRIQLTLLEYTGYFFRRFLECWTSIVGYVPVSRTGTTPFTCDSIGVTLILLIPFTIFFFHRGKKQLYLSMGISSMSIAIIYQFTSAAAATYGRGNLGGGVQSRYYQCAIGLLALCIIWMICRSPIIKQNSSSLKSACNTNVHPEPALTELGTATIAFISLLLLYDGFISTFLLSEH
ncbi:hypothetical protein [Bifidobacterium mongoliense]|uniref:hypothetical protein n=1 Tax=Bifidobacterium mongoliense TaxID=518643 RepID=UPI0030EE7767